MEVLIKEGEKVDDLQRNGYRIIQDPERFCFGMDAVLLSGFAKAKEGAQVLDLGTGTGILPILLAAKTRAAHLIGLEIQEDSADMARRSVCMNDLQERISVVTGDIKEAEQLFPKSSFDVITSNPPYMIDAHGLQNEADAKTIARHEVLCSFADVAYAVGKLLKPGGHFYLVHRPFRLPQLMTELLAQQLQPKRMRMVHPYVDKEPVMVLIEATRGGKARLTVEKPLIIYHAPGQYTEELISDYGF